MSALGHGGLLGALLISGVLAVLAHLAIGYAWRRSPLPRSVN